MGTYGRGRTRRSMLAAILLSLTLAGQAVGATWSPPIALSSPGTESFGPGLVTLGSSTAVALYIEHDGPFSEPDVALRRSTDSGATWSPPLFLGQGHGGSISGRGSSVDVVWVKANGRLRYARSVDGGASFATSMPLSTAGNEALNPSVARGPNALVAVAWEDFTTGTIKVRVSLDGGASFRRARTVATTSAHMETGVAIGAGVIYVAYYLDDSRLRVKRSVDGGATWSAAARITNAADSERVSITAAGSSAYIAYTADNDLPNFAQARYRRTTNKGATWSSPHDLGPASWTTARPHVALRGGSLHAVFERCDPQWDYCDSYRAFYRRSADGTSWTAPERVSPTGIEAFGPSVGFAGGAIVLYTGYGDDEGVSRPYVRKRSP